MPTNYRVHSGFRLVLGTFLLVGFAVALLAPVAAITQTKKPITKSGLLGAVRLNGLSTQDLIRQVQQRGVSFQLTPGDESELGEAGARPKLIEAVRANYRPAAAPPTVPPKPDPASRRDPVPSGPPLSKAEIVIMLQAGTSSARIGEFVEARGVSFTLTEQITREIRAAGGNRPLLGAISDGVSTGSRGRLSLSPGVLAAPDYEDLIDQAQTALIAHNPVLAESLLQQAIKLDQSKATAYQLLGYSQLYYTRDMASAEKSMRAAIERGGEAVFKVLHDHGTGAFSSTCEGSFFVSKSGVTFRANSGIDTFDAADTLIKEAKRNTKRLFQIAEPRFNPFHITVTQSAGKTLNHNFAPLTGSEDESILITNLIESYH